MAGQFTETLWKAGRPLTEIPPKLAEILDATYKDDRDYVEQGREDDPRAQEIVRLGRIYANRKGLSFRYMFTPDGRLRFSMKTKRPYTKKNHEYWGSL